MYGPALKLRASLKCSFYGDHSSSLVSRAPLSAWLSFNSESCTALKLRASLKCFYYADDSPSLVGRAPLLT